MSPKRTKASLQTDLHEKIVQQAQWRTDVSATRRGQDLVSRTDMYGMLALAAKEARLSGFSATDFQELANVAYQVQIESSDAVAKSKKDHS